MYTKDCQSLLELVSNVQLMTTRSQERAVKVFFS